MSVSKATPGPWRMVRSANPGERWDIGIHAEPNANIHAECYAEFASKGDVRPAECEANARLIAAAPELRDALIVVLDCYRVAMQVLGRDARDFEASSEVVAARALLARLDAEREQERSESHGKVAP